MDYRTGVFFFLATVMVVSALRVITARNAVHSALWLVLAFFTSAATWLLLQAEFLAIALVLVYVGAVMVLFLFVLMMLDVNFEKLRTRARLYLPLGLLIGVLIVVEMWAVLKAGYSGVASAPDPGAAAGYSNTRELGRVLYTDYVYPFELAAVILLVAIVAAIALTLRRRKETRFQDPAEQAKVRKADRLRVLRMPAEKGD
jgi:NADH-quinone oxidoreductase subunit J